MKVNTNKLKILTAMIAILSMRGQIYYLGVLFSLLFLAASCSSDDPSDSGGKEKGTYDLRTIDGSALPFDEVVPPPLIREIEYVLILDGGAYTQTRTRLFLSETPSTETTSGTYTVSGGAINLINASYIGGLAPGQANPPITGNLSGQVLTLNEGANSQPGSGPGHVLVFDKRGPGPRLATIITTSTSAVTSTTATSGGIITNDGGAVISERGICYSTVGNPTITNSKVVSGSGTGSFTANITGLTEGTEYYVRAYAINSAGTSYGNEVIFTTLVESTVTDIDGNIYQTVTIGSQTWMKENLKVTHYRNGDPIPNVTNNTTWSTLTTGAYANYNNDATNVATYGRLYNWHAVKDARNIVPLGWHAPTDAELNTLVAYLGGEIIAGGKLKEAGTTHWKSPNTGATNSSGFTALPGGVRSYDGVFWLITEYAYVWSSVEYNINAAWGGGVYYNGNDVLAGSYYNKTEGFSIRCVKD